MDTVARVVALLSFTLLFCLAMYTSCYIFVLIIVRIIDTATSLVDRSNVCRSAASLQRRIHLKVLGYRSAVRFYGDTRADTKYALTFNDYRGSTTYFDLRVIGYEIRSFSTLDTRGVPISSLHFAACKMIDEKVVRLNTRITVRMNKS